MFAFRWKMLERCVADHNTLAVWEISALFRGKVGIDELSVDRDAAIEWYIADQVPRESREDYEAEPQTAEDEMWEAFEFDLVRMVEERVAYHGKNYPLELDEYNRMTIKPRGEVSAVGAAYLGLQFYRVWNAGLVEIEEQNEARRKQIKSEFNNWFPKLFEIIASYAVSGDQSGVPHLTANCRSSQRLHRMLTSLCNRVGSGRAKRYEDWSGVQLTSNDGGIDCLVHKGGPGMPGNASLILVGATVQASQIDRKIVGDDAKRRFSDYFAERPAAFQGALVRPADTDPLTVEKCRVRDCLLYTYDEVWKNLGKRTADVKAKRYFSYLDGKVRILARNLNGAMLIEGFDRYTLQL